MRGITALPCSPELVHTPVEHHRDAGKVAGVLHHGEEEVERQDERDDQRDSCDEARERAVPEYTGDRAGDDRFVGCDLREERLDEIGYAGADDKGPYEQPPYHEKDRKVPEKRVKGEPVEPVGQALFVHAVLRGPHGDHLGRDPISDVIPFRAHYDADCFTVDRFDLDREAVSLFDDAGGLILYDLHHRGVAFDELDGNKPYG